MQGKKNIVPKRRRKVKPKKYDGFKFAQTDKQKYRYTSNKHCNYLIVPEGKVILDATCGSRMMWFNKHHPAVIYMDWRKEEYEIPGGQIVKISPDIQADFRHIPFPDKSFKMVIFDPPHLKISEESIMGIKYGSLGSDWQNEVKAGIDECVRVLEPYGTLIFKWYQKNASVRQILDIIKRQPLVGHPTSKHGKTVWMTFMKL